MIFVAIDTETTGFGHDARIVELAAVRYVDGRETERFHSLINPGVPMPAEATAVNGITDAMLAIAPTPLMVLPAFLEFVGRDDVVGHNIEFDLRMLAQDLRRTGLPPLENEWACTLRMARSTLSLHSYKLGTVAAHLECSTARSHRALSDALMAGAVFLRLEAR